MQKKNIPLIFLKILRSKNMGKHYNQFTERERYQLEALLKAGTKKKKIAELLGKSVKTIYNEIKRGTVELLNSDLTKREEYLADRGQQVYEENKSHQGANLKIGNDYKLAEYIEDKIINDKYSPNAVLMEIDNNPDLEFKTKICKTTLYSYIDKNIFLNLTNKHLPIKKQGKKQEYKRTVALKNTKGRSIEERPKEILNRDDIGHWELDTVVGARGKGKACLLVFTERATRTELIRKIQDKKAESVVKALDKIEKELGAKKFRETFKTITMDNGVEFLDNEGIEKSCINKKTPRTTTYYCHPYASSERGSNENANKLIRRFVPKGDMIENYSDEDIAYIEHWMNNYPRKIFGGKTANQMTELFELCKNNIA